MIERIYLKNSPLFDEIDLECHSSLNVFSGASGAGKSLFMESLLSLFGIKDISSEISEATIALEIETADFGIESSNPTIFKAIKKEKSRYFINNQSISKKNLKEISKDFIKYISLKESEEFKSKNLLEIIDAMASKKDKNHKNNLSLYKSLYKEIKELEVELEGLNIEERRVEELKDICRFEIEKIEKIDPKIGEYEELIKLKKSLSKLEKIENLITKIERIFELEDDARELFGFIESDCSAFDEGMNSLRVLIDSASNLRSELEEVNIEELLDRVEMLSSLMKRYGSLEESIKQKEKKIDELKSLENISTKKEQVQNRLDSKRDSAFKVANEVSIAREERRDEFNSTLEEGLNKLLLSNGEISFQKRELGEDGFDVCKIVLNGCDIEKVSSGEFNRLRLALLNTKIKYLQKDRGILILDEVDANLSGEESEGVAKILKELSSNYQVFAISHQPHLPSFADIHFLVKKDKDGSKIVKLDRDGKIEEIARMISGKEINQEAIMFARKKIEEVF